MGEGDEVKGEMKMMWTAGGPRGGGQQREWGLGWTGVKVDLQWGQIAELWEPCQEFRYLKGCHQHIPRGQARGM